MNKNSTVALRARGLNYHNLGKYKKSVADLNKYKNLNPEDNSVSDKIEMYELYGRFGCQQKPTQREKPSFKRTNIMKDLFSEDW